MDQLVILYFPKPLTVGMFNKNLLNLVLYVTDPIVFGYEAIIVSVEMNSFQNLLNKCLKTKKWYSK